MRWLSSIGSTETGRLRGDIGGRAPSGDYGFIARRFRISEESYDLSEVQAAVSEARQLATEAADEPAALFYALARRPQAFPEGWRVMARATAIAQAHALGYAFNVKPDSRCLDYPRSEW